MRKLWQDIQAHKQGAVLFLIYWVVIVLLTFITWDQGIPSPVALLISTLPLIAGILVGLWRSSTPEHSARFGDKTRGGMLSGLLCIEITALVARGGVIDELIGWMLGWGERFGEQLVGCIVFGVFGIILGFIGAALTSIIEHYRGRLTHNSG